MTRLGLVLTIASSLAIALSAQRGAPTPAPAPQQPVFRTSTDLIQVDTVVVDSDGKPVRGLAKEDFEILDNGKPQPIVALTEFHHEHPALGPTVAPPHVDVATNSGAAAQRLVIVVLDDLSTKYYHSDIVKAAVGKFFHDLGGQLQMALVRTSGRPGVELTNDPVVLLDALKIFEGGGMVQDYRGSDWLSLSRSGGPIVRPDAWEAVPRLVNTLLSLTPNDGRRKVLLFVSEASKGRVDIRDAAAITDPGKTPAERAAAQREILKYLDPPTLGLIRVARQANAAIYAIDPRGMAKPGQEGFGGIPFPSNDVARIEQAKLQIVAAETGGHAIVNTDDFAAGVARIVDELDNYYVLGFKAPDPNATSPHDIEVRVLRPGLDVRHRHSYTVNPPPTKADKAARKDLLFGLAFSPTPVGDVPLQLWAAVSPPDAGAKNPRVTLWLQSGEARIDEYSIYAVDLAKSKQTGKPVSRKLSGAVPALLPLEAFTLPPGRYQLRVAARSADAGRGGSVYLTMEIPDFAKTPLAITGLVLGGGNTRRPDLGSLPFLPTLERTFDATTTLRLAFDVWRKAPAPDTHAVVEIFSGDGAVARQIHDSTLSTAGHHVDTPVPLTGLTPGLYILRITATGGAATARQELGFQVR